MLVTIVATAAVMKLRRPARRKIDVSIPANSISNPLMRGPSARVRFNRANFFVALLLFGLFSLYKMPPAAPPTPPPTLPPTTPPPTTPPTACRLAVPVAQRAPGSPARRPQPAPELAPLRGACARRCPESCMLLTLASRLFVEPQACFALLYPDLRPRGACGSGSSVHAREHYHDCQSASSGWAERTTTL